MPGETPGLPSKPTDEARQEDLANIVAAWRSMASALVPVIGERGVAALLERSIARASRQFAWLQPALGGGIAGLESAFARRGGDDVRAAHAMLFGAFVDLLEHLVGRELAQRLLANDADAGDEHA